MHTFLFLYQPFNSIPMQFRSALFMLAAVSLLTACNKKDESPVEETPATTTTGGSPTATTTPSTSGYYLHWESFTNSGNYNANAFAKGKVFHSPYTYSEDYGETWKSSPDDGLFRTLVTVNDLPAEKNISLSNQVITLLSSGTSITFSNSSAHLAWDGGTTAYAWSDGALYKSTTGGSSWSAITAPPLHNQFIGIIDLDVAGSSVFVVQHYLESPGNFNRYILQTSNDNGTTWIESEVYSVKIAVSVYAGNDVVAKLGSISTTPQGSFKISVGSSITFTPFEFDNGINSDAAKIMRAAENNYIFGFTYSGVNVKHPSTGKYFNASDKPSSFSGGVITDKYLIVTSGKVLYRTPFPLVFHDTP